jgi:hypothetical protein
LLTENSLADCLKLIVIREDEENRPINEEHFVELSSYIKIESVQYHGMFYDRLLQGGKRWRKEMERDDLTLQPQPD